MAPFRERSDVELDALTDEELIAYIVAARRHGRREAATLALQILVYGHMDQIEYWVSRKVPAEAVDEVAGKAFMSALFATLRGESVGEFRSFLWRITRRRIADYHRSRRPDTEPLAEEHGDEEDVHGALPFEPDATAAAELMVLVDDLRARLEPAHRCVVDRYVLDGYTAAETAGLVNAELPGLSPPMSEANVHQIASRFREALRRELGEDAP